MNKQLEKLIETKQKLEQTILKLSKLLQQSKKKYNYIEELIIKSCDDCKDQTTCLVCGYEK